METSTVISPTMNRTRQAILETAARVLGQDASASLGTIAQQAGVGRTTLHRYFPDRASLAAGVNAWVREQFEAVVSRARLGEGSGLEALVRLGTEYYEISDVLAYAFNAPAYWEEESRREEDCVDESAHDRQVMSAIERGHADGSVDPLLPAAWIVNMLWSVLYTAVQYQIAEKTTRHETLEFVVRSLRKVAASSPG